MTDCLVLVPFEPVTGPMLDPNMRSTYLGRFSLPIEVATVELENYLGVRLDFWDKSVRPVIGGQEVALPKTRSLSAVVLSSALERAGLSWRAIDPGVRELDWWRRTLSTLDERPLTVAVCTTFVMHYPWLVAFCRIIRRAFPQARLLMGGYYYASNAKNFLSLDADVFCVGPGEVRLPAIVQAVRAGQSCEHIPGLYIRGAGGQLRHTGHPPLLDLRHVPPADWSLASRIEPRIDIDRDLIEVGVETQRGCVFQCEYCSYRTLSAPNALGPEEAADAILRTQVVRNGVVNILDATASFPHERWKAVLRAIIARGGPPRPLWAFARVSDINEESASLMAAAGVRHLFIGQESGDQRVLDLMKKGTKVKHIQTAIDALAKHKLHATLSFIHGFPGETAETIATTRHLIERLNAGHEGRMPVPVYVLFPFLAPDFAAISARDQFDKVDHYMDYGASGLHPDRIVDEALQTMITVSRSPHAPFFGNLILKSLLPSFGLSMFNRPDTTELHRWLKSVERGVVLFLEKSLEGKRIDTRELRTVRDTILAAYPPSRREAPRWHRRWLVKPVMQRLQHEWNSERRNGAGLATRLVTGATVWQQTHDAELAWRIFATGDLVKRDMAPHAGVLDSYADQLIEHARTTPKKYPKGAIRSEPVQPA